MTWLHASAELLIFSMAAFSAVLIIGLLLRYLAKVVRDAFWRYSP